MFVAGLELVVAAQLTSISAHNSTIFFIGFMIRGVQWRSILLKAYLRFSFLSIRLPRVVRLNFEGPKLDKWSIVKLRNCLAIKFEMILKSDYAFSTATIVIHACLTPFILTRYSWKNNERRTGYGHLWNAPVHDHLSTFLALFERFVIKMDKRSGKTNTLIDFCFRMERGQKWKNALKFQKENT